MHATFRANAIRILAVLVCGVFFLVLLAPRGARAEDVPYYFQEKVRSIRSDIVLSADSSLRVKERIDYDFAENRRHGIYRTLPYRYKARGGSYNLRISDIRVSNQNGDALPFQVSNDGSYRKIMIGDESRVFSGRQVYTVEYTVNRAVNYSDDQDEIYWNVVGDKWDVTIEKAEASIILPKKINKSSISATCFKGEFGSTDKCGGWMVGYSDDQMTDHIDFSNGELAPGQAFTVVAGFPKHVVAEPSFWQKAGETTKDNVVLALPIIVSLFMLYRWRKFGRDAKGRDTIVPQYDAPPGLTPAEIGILVDERADSKDISAVLIGLAVAGYVKISRVEKDGKLLKSTDYKFLKLKDGSDLKSSVEKKFFDSLFEGGKESVLLSDLKYKFHKDWQAIVSAAYKSTVDKGYFSRSPQTTRWIYLGIAFFVLLLGIILIDLGTLYLASFAISALAIGIIGYFMPAKTAKGVEAKEYILGLKSYLEVAEKDRIKFHNAPEKNPERFEKLLPFAMALGVEKAWAKQFEDIYKQPPQWYSDPSMRAFNPIIFTNSMNDFSASAKGAFAAAPSSAASGGSGFSGGGSGGGFGGGGGGSW
ncbi:MAG: DUF2207 domain-containing protein [Patescibacteria group bacterium]|jgi:uncharacterized membrane protein